MAGHAQYVLRPLGQAGSVLGTAWIVSMNRAGLSRSIRFCPPPPIGSNNQNAGVGLPTFRSADPIKAKRALGGK